MLRGFSQRHVRRLSTTALRLLSRDELPVQLTVGPSGPSDQLADKRLIPRERVTSDFVAPSALTKVRSSHRRIRVSRGASMPTCTVAPSILSTVTLTSSLIINVSPTRRVRMSIATSLVVLQSLATVARAANPGRKRCSDAAATRVIATLDFGAMRPSPTFPTSDGAGGAARRRRLGRASRGLRAAAQCAEIFRREKLSLRGLRVGAVTGTLLAGVPVGQIGITLPNEVQQCFFCCDCRA